MPARHTLFSVRTCAAEHFCGLSHIMPDPYRIFQISAKALIFVFGPRQFCHSANTLQLPLDMDVLATAPAPRMQLVLHASYTDCTRNTGDFTCGYTCCPVLHIH